MCFNEHVTVLLCRSEETGPRKKIAPFGFWQVSGSKHDKWTNGQDSIAVPRHREINEYTAKAIIKEAELAKKRGKQSAD